MMGIKNIVIGCLVIVITFSLVINIQNYFEQTEQIKLAEYEKGFLEGQLIQQSYILNMALQYGFVDLTITDINGQTYADRLYSLNSAELNQQANLQENNSNLQQNDFPTDWDFDGVEK